MAIIDSVAAFAERARRFGLSDTVIQSLTAANVGSFGSFAFVAVFNPAAVDDTPLSNALENIIGSTPTVTEMAFFRRLHFESHALTVADARVRVEQSEESVPRRLPGPERAARYESQKTRLTGLVWSLTLEPSHRLLDRVQQQIEDNTAAYVSLDHCTSRQQELAGVKKNAEIKIDPITGLIRVGEKQVEDWANTSTDHNLRLAFRRRALAYDQSNLATYEIMEAWTEKLFDCLNDMVPTGFSATTRERILSADRQLFSKVTEHCRSGVVAVLLLGRLTRPVEAAVSALQNHPSVSFFLLPVPLGKQQAADKAPSTSTPSDPQAPTRSKRKRDAHRLKAATAPSFPPPAPYSKAAARPPKGKGKGKGKGDLPAPLISCWRQVKGEKACIFFNLGTCENPERPGETCRQGIHLCMVPQCGGLHPAVLCPLKVGRSQ